MSPMESFRSIWGIGPGRRRFHENLLRYFAGDLDRVEQKLFEIEIMSSRQRKRVFAAEWDVRTREHGLGALGVPDPDLADCFSVRTLESYVRGRLSREDRALVEHHLSCPFCGAQEAALREEIRHRARLSWRERVEEFVGRTLGWLMRPGVWVGLAAAVLVVIAFRGSGDPETTSPAVSTYRGVSDGTATLELFATTPGGEAIRVRDGVAIPSESRLRLRGSNEDIEFARYFAVFSTGPGGEVTWHLPSWEYEIPPQMLELPPGAHEETWTESGSVLLPGRHRLVLIMSHAPVSLSLLKTALTQESRDDMVDISTLVDMVGRRATISLSEIRVR